MTVTTTANSITYAGNGVVAAFAFPYIFFAPTDLVVTLIVSATGVAVTPPPVLNGGATYDYTVTGDVSGGEYPSGGTVTFNTAPIAGHTVSLVRAVPATQTVTLIDNTKFPAQTINTEFDYLTVLAQQISAATTNLDSRALQIPSAESGLVVIAVPAASRANKLLLWDGDGNLSTLEPASIIGGAVPAGPAGGDLAGTYPSPTIKASVGLTGTPTAPTASPTANTTQIATTAFVASASGRLLQTVSFQTGVVANGTTQMPHDDTIPQQTEGDQYMTLAITPRSATSRLIIDVVWNGCSNIAGVHGIAVALFQDSAANALAATLQVASAANYNMNIKFSHTMTSGTISATTFKVRAGVGAAGSIVFNGNIASRLFGGVMASSIVIQEVAP